MKAMILAAGLGTRLRPITNSRPKALVEIAGRTLLEITITRLREFGIREVIINVHHFADMLIAYLDAHANFGMRIEVSREDVLLDTGGGLKNASWFFLENSAQNGEPFLLHNVDVISDIEFQRMLAAHTAANALATLAIQQRETSRYLLFDDQLQLCGRRVGAQEDECVRPSAERHALAFSGIHVISPQIFAKMTETGVFSIIDAYLRLARQGEKILGFRADQYLWRDLGTRDKVARAEEDLRQKLLG